jgi:hypothetical protein
MPSKRNGILRLCAICDREFPVAPSTLKRGRGLHCSLACYRASLSVTPIMSTDGSTALIPLHARDGSVRAHVIVDAADAGWVVQWRWRLDGAGYASRAYREHGIQRTVALHRALLGHSDGDGFDVDHIDRDRMNCRRSNLRDVPRGKNVQNIPSKSGSSIYRGVSWHQRARKWVAFVGVDGKSVYLGSFDQEGEAAEAARLGRLKYMPYAVD